MNQNTVEKTKISNRIKIILVATLFLAPVVIATVLKFVDWHPATTGNFGELIQPARPLTALEFKTLNDSTVATFDSEHQWLMLTFATGNCDKYCEGNIYKIRQAHISMGKYYKRVRRLLVLTSTPSKRLLTILKSYPDMAVTVGPTKAIRSLGKQLHTLDGTAMDGLNRLYFIDPLGNFMMTYDKNAEPAGVRKDLRRLLRVSRIG
ncbi:MAG: hypothetical protein V3S12_05465 [Acidiferrobacterales bacterium]